MTEGAPGLGLSDLTVMGWSDFFDTQRKPDEEDLLPARISGVQRTSLAAITPDGTVKLTLAHKSLTADFAVGDWVLLDRDTLGLKRRLARRTVLQRRTEGRASQQLAAANVDTLFIVTSCNADFNPARLERYLALANQAGTRPVIVLTKADIAEAGTDFKGEARALQRGLDVVVLNAKSAVAAQALAPWCGMGETVALVGSSGVGKSTLVNTLAALEDEQQQETGDIRERDAKGRHTTTSRSLHRIAGGGWIIDTPGIRTLHVSDVAEGIEELFAEITELAPQCKFRDCTHQSEPGCAVQAAVKAGTLPAERLDRWRKLADENRGNTPVLTGPRGNKNASSWKKRG